ncbi:MAG: serine/threonine protein kinase [Methanomicrobia archaeon]|jgi:serine/threonine-protein kinase|nr:serine/threonine protein kinase [Methanomicrobia archaeon]
MIKIGDKVDGRYRITSRLGSGGMSEVYEATDVISKRIVAVKIMKEELMSDFENIRRFKHEVAAVASFQHPNIIKVYNNGEINGRPYMANEYVKGQTLHEKLMFLTKLQPYEACEIMLQILSAVIYIHNHGVIHRDIKPHNVYYMADGTIKLGDFGIATNEEMSQANPDEHILGSVHYLAPELCQGKKPSPLSDIYAAGITFFELVTGHVPFDEALPVDIAVAHIKRPFPYPSKLDPSISKEVEKIIVKACRKNPLDRYQSAQEMYDDIEHIMKNRNNFKEKKSFLSRVFGFK